MQGQSLAVDLHGHGIHQERHIVIDHLDDRVRGLPSIFLALWIVNAQLWGAGYEYAHKIQVRESRAAEIGYSALCEIFGVNLAVILTDERLGLIFSLLLLKSKLRDHLFNDSCVFLFRVE